MVAKIKKITLSQLKNEYLEYIKKDVDEDTLVHIKIELNHFCEIDLTKQVKTYPNKFITDFNKDIYEQWQKEMKEKKYVLGFGKNRVFDETKAKLYSIVNLNRIHGRICKMIDYAVINGYCHVNFARQCNKIGTHKEIQLSQYYKEYITIDYDEYLRLLEASKDNLKYNTFFDLAFTRGPRQGEIRAFRVVDYNYEKKQLMVNHTLSVKNKLKEPKTASSKAPIFLDDTVNEKINLIIEGHKKNPNFNENWFIFGDENPLSDNALINATKKYLKKANINKHIKLHGFRHSCATWLYSIGTPIAVISKILRHKNIKETLNTYTHLFNDDYQNGLNKINEIRKSS